MQPQQVLETLPIIHGFLSLLERAPSATVVTVLSIDIGTRNKVVLFPDAMTTARMAGYFESHSSIR